MARRIKESPDAVKFGIRVLHEDGKVGWIVGYDCDVQLYDSAKDAEKALKAMKKNTNYSWNCNVEVAEFNGFQKQPRTIVEA